MFKTLLYFDKFLVSLAFTMIVKAFLVPNSINIFSDYIFMLTAKKVYTWTQHNTWKINIPNNGPKESDSPSQAFHNKMCPMFVTHMHPYFTQWKQAIILEKNERYHRCDWIARFVYFCYTYYYGNLNLHQAIQKANFRHRMFTTCPFCGKKCP